jgi:hypothetical protein
MSDSSREQKVEIPMWVRLDNSIIPEGKKVTRIYGPYSVNKGAGNNLERIIQEKGEVVIQEEGASGSSYAYTSNEYPGLEGRELYLVACVQLEDDPMGIMQGIYDELDSEAEKMGREEATECGLTRALEIIGAKLKSDSSEGEKVESPMCVRLANGIIPEGKKVTRIYGPYSVNKGPGDDLERVIQEQGERVIQGEASGYSYAYISTKGPDPQIHFVTYLQLEDGPDHAGKARDVYKELFAEINERVRPEEEHYQKIGGLTKAFKLIRESIPKELIY